MPGYVNGIPHATSTDRIDLWPTTSRNIALWVDENVPRNDDPRLSDARPPTAHEHALDDVTGLQAALDGKTDTTDPRLSDARPPTAHQHALADVTGLQGALNGKTDTTDPRLSDARPPTSHTHPISGVTGLQGALDGKTDTTDPRLSDARTPTAHEHALDDVTGLADRLAALEYSSGVRDITALFPEITSGTIKTTRAGWVVTTTFYGVRISGWPEEATYLHLEARMPDGFTPERGHIPIGPAEDNGSAERVRIVGGSGQVTFYRGRPAMSFFASFTYPTEDPAPTLPPGSAA